MKNNTKTILNIFQTALLAVFALFLCTPTNLFASTLSLTSSKNLFAKQEQFYVDVVLSDVTQKINAIDASVMYPETVRFVGAYDTDSIITNWVLRPQDTNRTISFAGIVSGGFMEVVDPLNHQEKTATIIRLIFEPIVSGKSAIDFSSNDILLNDGLGTKDVVSIHPFSFTVTTGTFPSVYSAGSDTETPSPFTIYLITDDNIFAGKQAIAFKTEDKGSGIKSYLVKEGNSDFVLAESPFLLKNQNASELVSVKAVDNSGNERIETLQVFGENVSHIKLFVSICSLLVILSIIFLYRKRKERKLQEEEWYIEEIK